MKGCMSSDAGAAGLEGNASEGRALRSHVSGHAPGNATIAASGVATRWLEGSRGAGARQDKTANLMTGCCSAGQHGRCWSKPSKSLKRQGRKARSPRQGTAEAWKQVGQDSSSLRRWRGDSLKPHERNPSQPDERWNGRKHDAPTERSGLAEGNA